MANPSKFIKDGSKHHASRLVNAMKKWDEGTFFSDPPKGVFGSKVIVKCNGAVIKSDDLDISFTIPFDDDMEANEAEITIYNLSNTTLSRLKKDEKITVEAGFKNDTGVVFSGYIDAKNTTEDGGDCLTTLKCVDRVNTTELKDVTYKAGSKASTILKDLINKTGTPIAVFAVRRDYTYKDEVKVDGDLMSNIRTYAEVCGISVYVSEGKIYARYLKEGDNLNFTVNENTGLIGSPSEYEEEIKYEESTEVVKGYEFETIMQHRFRAGGIIKLSSKKVNGEYRIRSGEHTFSNGEAVSRVKVF